MSEPLLLELTLDEAGHLLTQLAIAVSAQRQELAILDPNSGGHKILKSSIIKTSDLMRVLSQKVTPPRVTVPGTTLRSIQLVK